MKIYNIQTNLNSPTEKEDTRYSGNFDGDIHMTMGPISLYQFNEFASHGLMALRLFQYMIMSLNIGSIDINIMIDSLKIP